MACFVIVVDDSGVNETASIHGDFPGSQITAARKSGIDPQTAIENLGMLTLIQVNKQLTDILPHLLSHHREPFQPFEAIPVRYHHPIQFNQSPLLMFRFLENFLKPALEFFLAGNPLAKQVLLTLFLD
jgi:hypothetical protein